MSSKERKALGRGFGALLKTVDEFSQQEKTTKFPQLDIADIGFNPKQPRKEINLAKLEELAPIHQNQRCHTTGSGAFERK